MPKKNPKKVYQSHAPYTTFILCSSFIRSQATSLAFYYNKRQLLKPLEKTFDRITLNKISHKQLSKKRQGISFFLIKASNDCHKNVVERPHSGFSVSAAGLIKQSKGFLRYYGYSARILKYRCYNNGVSIIQEI